MTLMPLAPILRADVHGLAHGPAVGDALLQLDGDALADEQGVELGLVHLPDVDVDVLVGDPLEVDLQALDLLAAAADDDARAGPCG